MLTFFGGLLTDKLKPKARAAREPGRRAVVPVRAVALLPVDYGVFCRSSCCSAARGCSAPAYAALFAVARAVPAAFLRQVVPGAQSVPAS